MEGETRRFTSYLHCLVLGQVIVACGQVILLETCLGWSFQARPALGDTGGDAGDAVIRRTAAVWLESSADRRGGRR